MWLFFLWRLFRAGMISLLGLAEEWLCAAPNLQSSN